MKLRSLAVAALAVVLGLTAAPAGAQEDARALEILDVQTSRDGVSMVVTAPAELGGIDLPATAFSVAENGEPRAATVTRLGNDTLEVVLLVDTSGSMQGEPLAAAQRAAIAFLDRMPAGIKIGVVSFGTVPIVVAPVGSDRAQLQAAIGRLTARGETALYDGLLAATTQLSPPETQARRTIVVLSDGGDTVSTSSLEQATDAVVAADAELSAVALLSSETDMGALGRIAERTSGRVVEAGDAAALTSVYQAVASGITNRYQLAFRHEVGGPTEVTVAVDHGGVRASAAVPVVLPRIVAPALAETLAPATVDPGLFARSSARAVGITSLFVALLLAGLLLFRPSRPRRLPALDLRSVRGHSENHTKEARRRAVDAAERMLDRRSRTGAVNDRLEQAGLSMRPGELVVVIALAAVAAALLGFLLAGLLGMLALGTVVVVGSFAWLNHKAESRRAAFAEQLGANLGLLAGNLRAGNGVLQALDSLARDAESPSREEFRRVVTENRLGRDLSQSLRAMVDRVGGDDLRWVVEAIEIHREVGGDLAEVLDKVGATIRDRDAVRRSVQVLSAEGRFSGYILTALPFVGFLVLLLLAPSDSQLLLGTTTGNIALAAALGLVGLGWVWMRRLVRLIF